MGNCGERSWRSREIATKRPSGAFNQMGQESYEHSGSDNAERASECQASPGESSVTWIGATGSSLSRVRR
jgi:hypothetical protein